MQRPVRILDFDSSLTRQHNLIRQFNPLVTDMRRSGLESRLWMSAAQAAKIKKSLDPRLKNAVTLFGSGDFHHISSLLISQFEEPLSVIVFDHHPDWDIFPPKYGCGSWVSRVLEMPNVRKVVLVGASSDDISFPGIQSANLGALKDNRVEIYPYAHAPTRVFFRNVPDNIALQTDRGRFSSTLNWQELKNRALEDYFPEALHRLPTRKVYVSIDKDCLVADDALTNWEEGCLRIDELLLMLGLIRDRLEIAGADITGEYSLPRFSDKIKALASRLDHPKEYTARGAPEERVNAVNEKANMRILEKLAG